jgi:hypothetical protein
MFHVQDLNTLDQLAQEAAKRARRRNISWVLLLIFLLVCAIDYALYWARSSAVQRQIELTLNSYPLPKDSTQFDFGSGHQPHHGWATRALLSSRSPQALCDFYLTKLTADGWHLENEDCIPSSIGERGWRDVDKGHCLLLFRRERNTLRVRYFGRDNNMYTYRLTISWRA